MLFNSNRDFLAPVSRVIYDIPESIPFKWFICTVFGSIITVFRLSVLLLQTCGLSLRNKALGFQFIKRLTAISSHK